MLKRRIKSDFCGNCGFELPQQYNFCPQCGQENNTHKVPVKYFLLELFEKLLHFNSRTFITIYDLIVHPGRVIKDYNQNKRARYVPPIRLYIFVSFIFFLLINFLTNTESTNKHVNLLKLKDSTSIIFAKYFTKRELVTFIDVGKISTRRVDSLLISKKLKSGFIKTRVVKTVLLYLSGQIDFKDIINRYLSSVAGIMFFLMPFFAFLLLFFLYRQKIFYTESVVFALYFHSYIFSLISIWVIINFFYPAIWLFLLILKIATGYLVLSIRRVYNQGWITATIETTGILAIYILAFLGVLLLAIYVSVFL